MQQKQRFWTCQGLVLMGLKLNVMRWSSSSHPVCSLHVDRPLLPTEGSMSVGMAQVVGRLALRDEVEVSAVSPQEQPLVQLMLPAAKELAAKAAGRAEVGASGLKFSLFANGTFILTRDGACYLADIELQSLARDGLHAQP